MAIYKHADLTDLKKRLTPLGIFIVFCLVVLVARLFYLQIVMGNDYRTWSDRNRISKQWVPALRGNILDREGRLLVSNKPSFDLLVTRAYLKTEILDAVRFINTFLDLDLEDPEVLARKIQRNNRFKPLTIRRDLSREQLALVESHRLDDRLDGFDIEVSHIREELQLERMDVETTVDGRKYRLGSTLGKFGLEAMLESYLKGVDGTLPVEVDARGRVHEEIRFASILPFNMTEEPQHGLDVFTTIDLDLELTGYQTFTPEETGALVALHVPSGDILAMVSRPSFDPHQFSKPLSKAAWKYLNDAALKPLTDRCVAGLYSPGSTYKPLVALAALEAGVIDEHFSVDCKGEIYLGNHSFGCWKKGGHGVVSLHNAICQSCDVWFYRVGALLGVDALASWAKRFGLGQRSPLNLNHERSGLVPSSAWKEKALKIPWQKGETLITAIGQGFTLVSPLQLALMTATIANRGTLIPPHLIKKIVSNTNGFEISPPRSEPQRMKLSAHNLNVVIEAMGAVVNQPGGTAYWFCRLPDLPIAGKTGTVQVVRKAIQKEFPKERKYKDHALFIAFAPVHDPELAVAVVVEHGEHGSSGASPKAKAVIERYFAKQRDRSGARGPVDPGHLPVTLSIPGGQR